ncbi:hypothetical protein RU85_GL000865 [Lactococcus garvieae]|nr:hypothetical protein RU85_GL000865 [Lactococcus garvieae]
MIGTGSPIVTGGSVISGVSGTIGGTVGVMGCGFSGVIGTPPAFDSLVIESLVLLPSTFSDETRETDAE